MFKYKYILLIMLLVVLNYSCKRSNLEPENSQVNLPQKVQFDKVKSFYENGRYKNQPKRTYSNGNERMTAVDSARFKDYEPSWSKTEIESLSNNERILIVPIMRYLEVDYNDSIAFVRKLIIRIDENDNLLDANIVEIVGEVYFVPNNYKNIFKNYKNSNITDFTGIVSIYEIDYDLSVSKEYVNGVFTQNTQMKMVQGYCHGSVSVWVPNGCPKFQRVPCLNIYGTWETTYTASFCTYDDGMPNPSSGDDNNDVGGGGYDPSSEPQQPICKKCPKDNGISYEDEGILNFPPVLVVDPTLNNPYHAKIKCVYNKIIVMPRIKKLLREFKGSGITLTFKVENMDERGQTRYDPIANMYNIDIVINPAMMSGTTDYSHLGIAKTIIHEILHAKMFAWIIDMGGMNGSNSEMQDPGATSSTINQLMIKYKENNTIVADMPRVQHEYIAAYQHALLASLVAAYDNNRATQAQYEALAWDGLENTNRYDGTLPNPTGNSLGYGDPYMHNNRVIKSDNLKDSRKSENPCD